MRDFTKGFRQPKRGAWQLEWVNFRSPLPEVPYFTLPSKALGVAVLLAVLGHFLPWEWAFYVLPLFGLNELVDTGQFVGDPAANVTKNRECWTRVNSFYANQTSLNSRTINAGANTFSAGATTEARIQLAINQAVAELAGFVYVPAFMLPYNASLVTFVAGVCMTREGGNPDVYDVRAYGAKGDGIADDTAAQQAAISAIPANGGVVHYPSAPSSAYLTSAQLIVPSDRIVTFRGDGAFATNQGGLISHGAIIRRAASYTSGPLMSQTGSGGISKFGVQMFDMGFDGNNLAGDLLSLINTAQVYLSRVVFFNNTGNGLYTEGFQNSWIDHCQFYELGNNTAFPNGKSALVLNSGSSVACNTVLITDCQWESGRGSYLTSDDLSVGDVLPVALVSIIGGKMEFSGNSQVGFPPSPAPGVPLVVANNITQWFVTGIITTGGYHTAATHWRLQNCFNSQFDLMCSVQSGLTDAQNPRFLVDLFSGVGGVVIGGTFINGASISAGTGAQIRVVESSMPGYRIAPDSQFITPISGIGVSYTNPTTGKASRMGHSGAIQDKSFSLTGAVSTALNANDGNYFPVTIGSDIAVVVAIPTNPPPTGQSQEIVIEFFNNTAGALATAPTFATGTNGFLLPGTIVNPASGTSVLYPFRWSVARSKWVPCGSPQAAGV